MDLNDINFTHAKQQSYHYTLTVLCQTVSLLVQTISITQVVVQPDAKGTWPVNLGNQV